MSRQNKTGAEIAEEVYSDGLQWTDSIRNLSREDYQKMILHSLFIEEHSIRQNNFKLIRDQVNRDVGKWVCYIDTCGILVCAVSTYEDYYYMFIDCDRQIQYESCVGSYDELDPDNLPACCSILKWLQDNQPDDLKEIILKELQKIYDVPFSKIYLIDDGTDERTNQGETD